MSECFEFTNNIANAARLRQLLPAGTPPISDAELSFYLDSASEAIMNKAFPMGNWDASDRAAVLRKYSTVQLRIALALIAKIGVWGESAHKENGIDRSYDSADVPKALLDQITPHCKMYYSN